MRASTGAAQETRVSMTLAVLEIFHPFTAWVDNGWPYWYVIPRACGHRYAFTRFVASVALRRAVIRPTCLLTAELSWYAPPRYRGHLYAVPRLVAYVVHRRADFLRLG